MAEIQDNLLLISRRWKLLAELGKGESYVTELAGRIGNKKPDVSVWLTELEAAGFVRSRPLQKGRKYYVLSDEGMRWVQGIIQVAKKPVDTSRRSDRQLEEASILHMLAGVRFDDESQPRIRNPEVKKGLASTFGDVCTDFDILRYQEPTQAFQRILKDPQRFWDLNQPEISKSLLSGLDATVRHSSQNELLREWFGRVKELAQDRKLQAELRHMFIRMLRTYFDVNK